MKDINIKSFDDFAEMYGELQSKKMRWHDKIWFRIENYFERKLEQMIKMR